MVIPKQLQLAYLRTKVEVAVREVPGGGLCDRELVKLGKECRLTCLGDDKLAARSGARTCEAIGYTRWHAMSQQ